MIYVVYALHIVVCLFLILVVLLQQGKGADLSVFGGGSTQTAFGARGAATLLHKLTVISFVLFIVTTMSIALMSGIATGSSVIDDEVEESLPVPAAPVPLPAPATETPFEDESPATPAGDDAAGDATP
ncbi:MAG TPA: preprotein translocase subunit SecG [Thermoanaerobaculia bacterium]|nr:preprotein translocase subunit SecG [Thermoanaerobaculia bacterium]